MVNIMKIYDDIGVQTPQVYLPKKGTDLTKWAVIACDQFTSQPEYWKKVENLVGDAPSTLNLIFPEAYLEKTDGTERIQSIHSAMSAYLNKGIVQPRDGLIYIERSVAGKTRKGIVLCLDLERYDYAKDSASLIRATEGTIVDRLPPRMRIRQDAVLELPHILVVIDDPWHTVIEPVGRNKGALEKLYDFDLMFDSGHLAGYAVSEKLEAQVIESLRSLASPEAFAARYGISQDTPVLLFAMGDGNHSLATAKAVWEKMKSQVGPDHPARYALVEIENVHDEGLEFEPIHRVLFGLKRDLFVALKEYFGENFKYTLNARLEDAVRQVDNAHGPNHAIGLINGGKDFGVVEIVHPSSNLPVGTLQTFIDQFIEKGGADKIDYVHGKDVVFSLGAQPGNAGFYVSGIAKSELFKTVILDGVLPRKAFSMGEAREKRFYMETRKIT